MTWPRAASRFTTLSILLLVLASPSVLQANDAGFPFSHREKAPPFPENAVWLNTAAPLELQQLRGKFVLLDFWTYCCINCMHILPELHKLEQAWPKNLVVVGVHSAKFSTEQQTPSIRAAIQRYRITHPVINDARHDLWNLYGISVWPSLVLIDPQGNVVWGTTGEVTFEQLDKVLRTALPYYRQRHLLDETPLRIAPAGAVGATPLRFPGKIVADEVNDRLFIADSNHNRIVVVKLDGTLLAVIGSGVAGTKDGDFATAEFNQPQGMALHGNDLYVADTENHEIRRVDLETQKVATAAGTGKQAREGTVTIRRGDLRRMALSSPWDVLVHDDALFIAMAGCHQIWKMKLDGTAIGPYAGNGLEDIVDGPLLPRQLFQAGYASFAQPSGLATDGHWLYVADSEGSSIRAVPFNARGAVHTVVGTADLAEQRLFTFGDADGPAGTARFQHPLGLAYHDGKIYVADTYNSKIRIVDAADGTTQTLKVSGTLRVPLENGTRSVPDTLSEPAGLAVAAGKLYVADTNDHAVRTIDLASGQATSFVIAGLKPPDLPATVVKRPFGGEKLPLTRVKAENGQVRLRVELELPRGYELNPLTPLEYTIAAADSTEGPLSREIFGKSERITQPRTEFEIVLPVKAAGRDVVRLSLDYYYCREGIEGICKAGTAAWIVPLEISASASTSAITLRHRAK